MSYLLNLQGMRAAESNRPDEPARIPSTASLSLCFSNISIAFC